MFLFSLDKKEMEHLFGISFIPRKGNILVTMHQSIRAISSNKLMCNYVFFTKCLQTVVLFPIQK